MRLRVLGAAVLAVAALPSPGAAFPGSARWGYANCRSCHFNAGGGGILTPYGRQLSRELLSTWGGEKEAEFAYARVALPAWLSLGGDATLLRSSHGARDSDAVHLLNADLEMAVCHRRFLAVASVGARPQQNRFGVDGATSRRHFVQYDLTPTWSLRAGRFLPNYGVWNGDLSVATRTGLGWDENATSYNLELNRVAERVSGALTLIGGRLDVEGDERERGGAASMSFFFAGKRRVGLGLLATRRGRRARRAAGLHAVLGIGTHAYLLAETDVQRRASPGTDATWEAFSNWCFARETVKGLYVLVVDEMSRPRVGHAGRLSHSYGAALRWFPRPHFEMQLRWRRRDRDAISPDYMDGLSTFVRFYP